MDDNCCNHEPIDKLVQPSVILVRVCGGVTLAVAVTNGGTLSPILCNLYSTEQSVVALVSFLHHIYIRKMASRFSVAAEIPPTRKSIRRNERLTTEKQANNLAPADLPTEKLDHVDARGYKILAGKERFGVTPVPFTADDSNDHGRKRSNRIPYLEGIRGILGLQTLIWIFFRLFAPAIVTDTDLDGTRPATFVDASPQWMNVLRKAVTPLLFDGSLQMTFFIVLSGRTILQTYIERREAVALSGPAFRRPFRMVPPVAITLAIVSILIVAGAFQYADDLATALSNPIAEPPAIWSSTLEYFNSLVVYFFSPTESKTARAVTFIPIAGVMWFIQVTFQQVYVLIVFAWILPYTVLRYKSIGLVGLILVTAWVGRWSWYTLTGLAIAEYSVVYLPILPERGIPLDRRGQRFLHPWIPAAALALLGVFFKYLWAAALPGMADNEIIAHADPNTGKLNHNIDPAITAYPRYDDWLLVTGTLILIELSPRVQAVLSIKPLAYLGRLSFCTFSL